MVNDSSLDIGNHDMHPELQNFRPAIAQVFRKTCLSRHPDESVELLDPRTEASAHKSTFQSSGTFIIDILINSGGIRYWDGVIGSFALPDITSGCIACLQILMLFLPCKIKNKWASQRTLESYSRQAVVPLTRTCGFHQTTLNHPPHMPLPGFSRPVPG